MNQNIKWVARLTGFHPKYRYDRDAFMNRFPFTARCDSVFECRYTDGSSEFFAMRQNETEPHQIAQFEVEGFLRGKLTLNEDILDKVGFTSRSGAAPVVLEDILLPGNVDEL